MAILPVRERIAIFYSRLEKAPSCRNADEALALIIATLDEVEDEFSGVEKSVHPERAFDGRMYPPQADNIKLLADGGKIARTRNHRIVLSQSGSISIFQVATGNREFFKGEFEDES